MEHFFLNLILGACLICLTVVIHAVVLDKIFRSMDILGPWFFRKFNSFWKVPLITYAVMLCLCSHIAHIWIWALFYLGAGVLPDLETALYFSTATFTTVGYGDVVLHGSWRLIGSFQAANGFLLFGWSTAFIFEIMSKLYKENRITKTEKP